MFYTTDDLLSSIKLRSLAPVSQQTFTDSNLVTFMNEELQLHLVPDILSTREDFFLTSKRVALVSGVSDYGVPERAMGNALKQVYYVDAQGTRYRLIQTDVDIQVTYVGAPGQPDYFFFSGDRITTFPTPNASSGYIEFWYFQRLNQLVQTTSVTKITAINTVGSTTTFTVNTDLTSTITTSTYTDILSAKSPFLLWSQNVVPTAVTTTTIAYAATDVSNAASVVQPQVNDYICVAQQANIPMVPQEFHPILAQMVSARLLEALGHNEKLQAVMAKLKMMRDSAFTLIANRVESQPKKILNRQGFVAATGLGPWRSSY